VNKAVWLTGTFLVITVLLVTGCSPKPAPVPALPPPPLTVPATAPVAASAPGTTPRTAQTPLRSESTKELEDKIRQLETENQQLRSQNQQLGNRLALLEPENQRLRTDNQQLNSQLALLGTENQKLQIENQRLNSDLSRMANILQSIRAVVTSSSYSATLSRLSSMQSDTTQLAAFVTGLPHLPPLPGGMNFAEINQVVLKAQTLRGVLVSLPKLPPSIWPPFLPFPPELLELDRQRQTFIALTEWMNNLQSLPTFLQTARDLEEFRTNIETYIREIQTTMSEIKDVLQQVGKIVSP